MRRLFSGCPRATTTTVQKKLSSSTLPTRPPAKSGLPPPAPKQVQWPSDEQLLSANAPSSDRQLFDRDLEPQRQKAESPRRGPRYVRDWKLLKMPEAPSPATMEELQLEEAAEQERELAHQEAVGGKRLASLMDAPMMDVAEEAISATDPILDVKMDPRSQRPKFTAEQNEFLWEARKKEYSKMLHKFKIVLSSHLTEVDKCHQLLALHDVAMRKRLRMIDSIYDSVFHTFLVGLPQLGGGGGNKGVAPMLNQVWRVYRYMIDSGTNPTPKIHQHMMMILESVRSKNAEVEAKAHALMLDNDRFKTIPTEYTLQHYISICSHNGCMHIAMTRYTDARGRLQLMTSASLCSNMLRGLLLNDQIEEAVQFVQALDSVAMTDHLLNSVMQVMRRTKDPSSCFTMFRAIRGSGLPPSLSTVSTLLDVCYEINDFSEVPFILQLMKQYGVKGDERFSNKMLVALHRAGMPDVGDRFEKSLRKFGVRIYGEKLREAKRLSIDN